MAGHSKETGKVKNRYLFDFQDFIEELRSEEDKKKTIEDYEKYVLKGKKIKGDIRDQVWYKEYLSKFKPVPKYKVPEELEDDFDWDLLFQLVAGSFSSKYNWVYEDSVPELLIHVEDEEGIERVTKKVSELWSFQIQRLFEIYCEEQITVQLLPVTDDGAWNEDDRNELLREMKKKIRSFSRKIKGSGFKQKKDDIKADEDDENIVYFYCSLESAYGILKSGKIFASDLLYMNDKEELTFGVEVMMEALRTIAEDKTNYDKDLKRWLNKEFLNGPNEIRFKNELLKDHAYIACFTSKKDDLNQWRAYGDNGKGVCIKIDFNICEADELSDEFWMDNVIYIELDRIKKNKNGIRMLKKKKEWRDELKQIESCFKGIKEDYEKNSNFDIPDDLRRHLRFFKNISFKEEEEIRLLHIDRNSKYPTKIRVSKGYLIPYIELELGNVKNETSIKEITIGPAVDYNKAKRSFEEFFKIIKNDPNIKYDYSNVKILKSPIPYLP